MRYVIILAFLFLLNSGLGCGPNRAPVYPLYHQDGDRVEVWVIIDGELVYPHNEGGGSEL